MCVEIKGSHSTHALKHFPAIVCVSFLGWERTRLLSTGTNYSANNRHRARAVLMLGQRLRRWPIIKTSLVWRLELPVIPESTRVKCLWCIANTRRCTKVGLMLAHRLRRWTNIGSTLCVCGLQITLVIGALFPANTRHWPNVVLMSGRFSKKTSKQHWLNIPFLLGTDCSVNFQLIFIKFANNISSCSENIVQKHGMVKKLALTSWLIARNDVSILTY